MMMLYTRLSHRPQRVLVECKPSLQRMRAHGFVELVTASEVEHSAVVLRVGHQTDVQAARRMLRGESAHTLGTIAIY